MTRSHRDLRNCVAVASSALGRRWLIEQDILSFERAKALMASAAADVLVCSLQRKRSLVVVNQ